MNPAAMRLQLLKRCFFPSEVCAGRDALERLACLDPGQRVLLLSGGAAVRSGLRDKVIAKLKGSAAVDSIEWSGGEPTTQAIAGLQPRVAGFAPAWIVGLGGGSVLDAAKFIWAQFEHPELDYSAGAKPIAPLRKLARLALAPTTAGSGSEASQAAVLTNPAGAKVAYVSPHWIPDIAILDPAATVSLSPEATALGGFDALAHAIESAVSSLSHPMLQSLSATVVRTVLRCLPQAVAAPQDWAAREGMMTAAHLGGICQSTASTGAAHALSHAMAGLHHTAHGLATAFYLAPTMEWNLAQKPAAYDDLAADAGLADGKALLEAVRQLAHAVGIPTRLDTLVGREPSPGDLQLLSEAACKDICMRTNHCRMTPADVLKVLASVA